MSAISSAINSAERLPAPDSVTRAAIAFLVSQTARKLARTPAEADRAFARDMKIRAVAEHTDAANRQHYELPPEFFVLSLGPHRKYSCCYYDMPGMTLEQAERSALDKTISNAALRDGQTILELGCGWGSLTLAMAERFPNAKITAVSNSAPQRQYIEQQAQERGMSNVQIVTADMNDFEPQGRFDRVVSVEMFEHMANWRALLARVRQWVEPNGALFVHVFTHRTQSYRFEHQSSADWIGQHFFTGGIMPSRDLITYFGDLFDVVERWQWSGAHYQRTALHWLETFDANIDRIDPILSSVYGEDADLWRRRWRLFYMATAGLFGHAGGDVWGVTHYLLKPVTN